MLVQFRYETGIAGIDNAYLTVNNVVVQAASTSRQRELLLFQGPGCGLENTSRSRHPENNHA